MNKKKLEQYRALCDEVKKLEKRINKSRNIVSDKVLASNAEFPYQKLSLNITGVEDISRIEKLLKVRYNRCIQLKIDIEQFISEIEDSRTRQVFEYRYIDGFSWLKISLIMGSRNESYARKVHDRYLKGIKM